MASVSGPGSQPDLTQIKAVINQVQEGIKNGEVDSTLNNALIQMALIKNELPNNVEVEVTELINNLKTMNAQHEGQPKPSHEI